LALTDISLLSSKYTESEMLYKKEKKRHAGYVSLHDLSKLGYFILFLWTLFWQFQFMDGNFRPQKH